MRMSPWRRTRRSSDLSPPLKDSPRAARACAVLWELSAGVGSDDGADAGELALCVGGTAPPRVVLDLPFTADAGIAIDEEGLRFVAAEEGFSPDSARPRRRASPASRPLPSSLRFTPWKLPPVHRGEEQPSWGADSGFQRFND